MNHHPIEIKESSIYLCHNVEINKIDLNSDLSRQISISWAAFDRLDKVFRLSVPNTLKVCIFWPMCIASSDLWRRNILSKQRILK